MKKTKVYIGVDVHKDSVVIARVHSFQNLLADLAALTRNRVRPAVPGAATATCSPAPPRYRPRPSGFPGVRP